MASNPVWYVIFLNLTDTDDNKYYCVCIYFYVVISLFVIVLEYHATHCMYFLTLFKEGLSQLLIGH